MRIAHYLNQFFAGLGAEEAAGSPPTLIEGATGPGRGLGLEVAYTLACGDDYFAEQEPAAVAALLGFLNDDRPDVLVCGPAFASGRYGYACGRLGAAAAELGIPVVCGMEPENPGIAAAGPGPYVVITSAGVAGMRPALERMASLARQLGSGAEPEGPGTGGYLPRRRAGRITGRAAADRAVDLLLAKLGGVTSTEIPFTPTGVEPAPALAAAGEAVIGLVTESALVPRGNPDRLPRHRAAAWHRYSLANGLEGFESVHGGFDGRAAAADPNRLVPFDAAERAERRNRVGGVHRELFSTTGNSTPVAEAQRMGREMAREMKRAGVRAIVLTGT